MNKKNILPTKKECIFIGLILLIGVSAFGMSRLINTIGHGDLDAEGRLRIYAEITSSSHAHTVYLDDERTFSVDAVPNVVFEITDDGQIAFKKSDCPDQICVNTGFLNRSGQMAACLPNGVILSIRSFRSGVADEDVDTVI